jgi:protein-disulfide isomerase
VYKQKEKGMGWMSLSYATQRKVMVGTAVVVLGLGTLGYANSWFGGWLGAKEAPAAAAPAPQIELGALPATAAEALQLQPTDRVLGNFGAPLTVIEYASFTCSHCADFASQTFPQFERDWVNTGKAVYVLRELPWDNLALGMSAVARCVPPEQYYPLAKALFAAQKTIVTSEPLTTIKAVAGQTGLSAAQVDTCIGDANLQREVLRNKEIALKVLGVKGTPAFFINGTPLEGAIDYKAFNAALTKALNEKTNAKAQ